MRATLCWTLGVGFAAGGITFAVVARQSMPTYKSVILGVVFVLVGLAIVDRATYYNMPVERPNFVFHSGDGDADKPTYVVIDGFVGHPELRFAQLMDVFKRGHSVLFVNPAGDRYELEDVVQETIAELNRRGISNITPVALSLGAKGAYRLTQLWRGKMERLVFVDPLFNGHGVKNPASRVIGNWLWKPGAISNWLFGGLPARIITNNPKKPNPHQKYGLGVKLTRIADEARESNRPEIDGRIPWGIKVTILRCQDDGTLRGQWLVWRNTLLDAGHDVTSIMVSGTTHASLDTQPDLWRETLTANL